MAKAASRRVRRFKTEAQLVAEKADAIGLPREQLGQGVYRIRDIKIIDNDRTVTLRTLKNMAGNKVEEWLFIGGPGFDEPQRAAYEHCRALWEKVGKSRLTANYDQEPRHNSNGAGWTQQEAMTQLAGYQAKIPHPYWDIFENVVRFDSPVGVAGSELATNTPQQIASARTVVGLVLSMVAMWQHY